MYKYEKMVIGFDQSYTNTGISIAADGKLLKVTSTNYYKDLEVKSKTAKRNYIRNILHNILSKNAHKAKRVVIHVERIRTFSSGGNKDDYGLKPGYIKMTGALIACIVDIAYEFGVKVYSIDTRSWKAQTVGTAKNKSKDKKLETYEYVKDLGFDMSFINTRGTVKYDDDACDSACIALYGFIPKNKQRLLLEE